MSSKKTKITHLTSVHSRYDTRIFLKECTSLAKIDHYEVSLIVADNKGDEVKHNVHIYDVGKLHGRINRMFKTTKNVLQKAIELDSDIYHLHDPELLWIGYKLQQRGKIIIYDAHEDVPKQIFAKPYLSSWKKKLLSFIAKKIENFIAKRISGIITPTPEICERFISLNSNTIEVRNYPILSEFCDPSPWNKKKDSICYIGAIGESRGIKEMVQAVGYAKISFELGGNFRPAELQTSIEKMEGWEHVNFYGWVDRTQVQQILTKSKIGLAVLHPTDSYIESIPVKIFEYMAAGIPFIASNFSFWKDLFEEYQCGLFVDPLDPKSISNAVIYLLNNQDEAKKMGKNGQIIVQEKFNWIEEEQQLYKFYKGFK